MADAHDRDRASSEKARRLGCSACEVDGQWSARHPQGMARAQHAIAGNEAMRLEYEANPQLFMQRFGVSPAPQLGLYVPPVSNILERAVTSVTRSVAPEAGPSEPQRGAYKLSDD